MNTVVTLAAVMALVGGATLSRAQGPISIPDTRTHAAPVRARDLGVPFEGTPGANNAITDVPGVEVGFATLISGDGNAPLVEGQGPVRTGVTAVLPRGKNNKDPVFAGFFSQNGQRRDDRHRMDARRRLPRRPGDDHQHAQCRRSSATRSSRGRSSTRRSRNPKGSRRTHGRCPLWPRRSTVG